jgi:hypothetical protein
LKDFFFKGDGHLHMCSNIHSSIESFEDANMIDYNFTEQNNGIKNEFISLACSSETYICDIWSMYSKPCEIPMFPPGRWFQPLAPPHPLSTEV